MRPAKVARDLTDREIKAASYKARKQGRFALKNGQDNLAAFWSSVVGELHSERTRRFTKGMRADRGDGR